VVLVFSSLNYGSLPKQHLDRLQSVQCAERHCMADFHSSSSGPRPRPASTLQLTLSSSSKTDLVPAGSADVSLPPRLCTRLLVSDLQRVSDLNARRRLCCLSTSAITAPRTLCAPIGNRAFLTAAASVWNRLQESVRPSPSLPVFCSRLKTELFAQSHRCSD